MDIRQWRSLFLWFLVSCGAQHAEAVSECSTNTPWEDLAAVEQRIVAAADKARRSVVRIEWQKGKDTRETCSGVIFTADGYVVTWGNNPFSESLDFPPGKTVSVYLSDGRCAAGIGVGAFWDAPQHKFGLVKITEQGVWPNADVGRSSEAKPGDLCLAVGHPQPALTVASRFEREPSVRVGHLINRGVAGQLRSSCRIEEYGDRGGGLFDVEGRLIAVNGDREARDPGSHHFTVESIEQHWKNLVCQKPLTKEMTRTGAPSTPHCSADASPPSQPFLDVAGMSAAVAKAWQASVAIADVEAGYGFSGTIVTPDGYIATCAHHDLARGVDVTIHLSNGRAVPGKILGRDNLLDLGLAKITTLGPWPHVDLGRTTDAKVGDLCYALGFPNQLRKNRQFPCVVRVNRVEDLHNAPGRLLTSCKLWDGDSGGGLFDSQSRLLAVHGGGAERNRVQEPHAGVDYFQGLWPLLVHGPSPGDPVPFERSLTARAFRKAIENVPAITVEVLGDTKRRTLGTIVSSDGYILTKASELYGRISCRFADGRTLPASMRKTSREHDLTLLKVDATGLPKIPWSEREQAVVGTLMGVLRTGEAPLVGVTSHATRAVRSSVGYLLIGNLKDAVGGVEVAELKQLWTAEEPDSPLRVGDVIVHLDGRPTPNMKAFQALAKRDEFAWQVPFVNPGDPIRIGVRRGGKDAELRFPLSSPIWDPQQNVSPRNCPFPAVFDVDVAPSKDTCGGPVVDRAGQVVGIVIALPTANRVYVIPGAVARRVADELR